MGLPIVCSSLRRRDSISPQVLPSQTRLKQPKVAKKTACICRRASVSWLQLRKATWDRQDRRKLCIAFLGTSGSGSGRFSARPSARSWLQPRRGAYFRGQIRLADGEASCQENSFAVRSEKPVRVTKSCSSGSSSKWRPPCWWHFC